MSPHFVAIRRGAQKILFAFTLYASLLFYRTPNMGQPTNDSAG